MEEAFDLCLVLMLFVYVCYVLFVVLFSRPRFDVLTIEALQDLLCCSFPENVTER